MAEITRNEETNTVIFKMEDPSAFSAFRMSQDKQDFRYLDRTEESRELKDLIINNNRHSQMIVQYDDAYLPLKNR